MCRSSLPWCAEWWRTGEPPKLDLRPLWDFDIYTAESHALFATWKERPQLDDDEFYRTFYADSGISKQVVIDVRRELHSILGMSLDGVHPNDNMEIAAPYLDFADVFYRFDRVFRIAIPWRTPGFTNDLSFDSLVRLVADCLSAKAPAE